MHDTEQISEVIMVPCSSITGLSFSRSHSADTSKPKSTTVVIPSTSKTQCMSWTVLYRIYGLFLLLKQDLNYESSDSNQSNIDELKIAKENKTLVKIQQLSSMKLELTTPYKYATYTNQMLSDHLTYETRPNIWPSWWCTKGFIFDLKQVYVDGSIRTSLQFHSYSFPDSIGTGDAITNLTNYFSIFFNVFTNMRISDFPAIRKANPILRAYSFPGNLPLTPVSAHSLYQKVLSQYANLSRTSNLPSSSKRDRPSQTSSSSSSETDSPAEDSPKRQRSITHATPAPSSSHLGAISLLPLPTAASCSTHEPHIAVDFPFFSRIHALFLMAWGTLPEVSPLILPKPIWNSLNEMKMAHKLFKVEAINCVTGEMFISINEMYDSLIHLLVLSGEAELKNPSDGNHLEMALHFLDGSRNRARRFGWWREYKLFGHAVENYLTKGESILENKIIRKITLPKDLLETRYFRECMMKDGQPDTSIIAVFLEVFVEVIQPTHYNDFRRLGSSHENFQTGEFKIANRLVNNKNTAYQDCLSHVLIECKKIWMSAQN